MSLIYIVYKNVIGFFALKQFLHYIKTKKLVVRNSPLDPLGTFFRIFSAGIRTTGRLTVGSGFTYALFHELDEILVKEGKEPYFVPKLRGTIRELGLDSAVKTGLNLFGFKDAIDVKSNILDFHEKFKSFNAEEIKNFEKNSGISYNQGLSVIKYIEENSSGTIVKTITEEIEKKDPFETKANE